VSRLPNTTVWGVFNNLAEANTAFEKALAATTVTVSHPIKLEKRATIQASATQVLSDKRKKPEAKWTGKSSYETSDLHQINDPFFK
jgi:hypothetical protein